MEIVCEVVSAFTLSYRRSSSAVGSLSDSCHHCSYFFTIANMIDRSAAELPTSYQQFSVGVFVLDTTWTCHRDSILPLFSSFVVVLKNPSTFIRVRNGLRPHLRVD